MSVTPPRGGTPFEPKGSMFDDSATTRIGVLADVHLRLDALRRTLDGPLAACAPVICAGDVLDRGADEPAAVFAALDEHDVTILLGNHELACLGGPDFPGMAEPAGRAEAAQLRDRILDGTLRAAWAVDADTLCVHGGISHRFWDRHLRATCGSDARRIAMQLDRWLVNAVATRSFDHPSFAAMDAAEPGPYWARIDDLVRDGLPPFAQVVGHVRMPSNQWLHDGEGSGGRIRAVDTAADVARGFIGHVVLEPVPT